ncbi:MAG: MoaD/ThiS family protein [Thermoplasmata archaeon]
MHIKVEFYGSFREEAEEISLILPDGATIASLLAALAHKMPSLHQKITATETMIVVVNGKRVEKSRELEDGDVVKFFSSVLGG